MLNYSNYRSHKAQQKKRKQIIIITYLMSTLMIGFSLLFLTSKNFNWFGNQNKFNTWLIGGIPAPIIVPVLTDYKALGAYVSGNNFAFRNRLKELNVDTNMRNLYRPYFRNEVELEQYIDQIFYNDTGYVNSKEYVIDEKGNLIRKKDLNQKKILQKKEGLFNIIKPNLD